MTRQHFLFLADCKSTESLPMVLTHDNLGQMLGVPRSLLIAVICLPGV